MSTRLAAPSFLHGRLSLEWPSPRGRGRFGKYSDRTIGAASTIGAVSDGGSAAGASLSDAKRPQFGSE